MTVNTIGQTAPTNKCIESLISGLSAVESL